MLHHADPCPTCHGRGYQSQPPDADGPADERECPACGGDGVERLTAHESDEWTPAPAWWVSAHRFIHRNTPQCEDCGAPESHPIHS
jgi:hypothetical protein